MTASPALLLREGVCPPTVRWAAGFARRHPAGALVVVGLALELVFIAGLTVPLSIPGHPYVVISPRSLAVVLGGNGGGAARFIAPTMIAFVCFALAVWMSRRVRLGTGAGIVLAGTVIFSLTLLPMNPLGAHDVYHDIADARTVWIFHQDPAVVPPSEHPADWFAPAVPSWRTTPSAYGPVWYELSSITVPLAGQDLWANVVAQKTIAALFLLALTATAMALAARMASASTAAAGVLIGWNPLLQFETAGNAHNDVVMAFFVLAALYALARGWRPLVFPLLALAIATKPVLAVLAPLLLAGMIARGEVRPKAVLLMWAGLGLATLAVLYAPFFHGAATLSGLHREASHVTSSPGAVARTVLRDVTGLHDARVLRIMELLAWPPCLAAYALLLWRLRRGASIQQVGRASYWVAFVGLTALTWWFMPWYLFWLVPLAAPLTDPRPAAIAVAFSCGAMLSYAAHFWLLAAGELTLDAATAATAFLPPLAVLAWLRLSGRHGWTATGTIRGGDGAWKGTTALRHYGLRPGPTTPRGRSSAS